MRFVLYNSTREYVEKIHSDDCPQKRPKRQHFLCWLGFRKSDLLISVRQTQTCVALDGVCHLTRRSWAPKRRDRYRGYQKAITRATSDTNSTTI
jgi:hypothetical protein